MRTTVDLEKQLLVRIKREAHKQGVSLSAFVEAALRSVMARPKRPSKRPFKLVTVTGELVNPELNLDRTSDLLANEDEHIYRRN